MYLIKKNQRLIFCENFSLKFVCVTLMYDVNKLSYLKILSIKAKIIHHSKTQRKSIQNIKNNSY